MFITIMVNSCKISRHQLSILGPTPGSEEVLVAVKQWLTTIHMHQAAYIKIQTERKLNILIQYDYF